MVANVSKSIVDQVDELPQWTRYAVAIAFPFIALGLSALLWAAIMPIPGVLFFAAIALSSWVGGFRAGLARC
jgi:hypothetical protein